ncbi:PaaI family thioesterase [Chitinolyticbacter albus]|uniref:PaaI family thioesterase n=1 Tax=Chitinolyticbacter albus TaxID=2961951 RepID=UPI00210B34A6|nr:PaaI family thioesterase [Chitinolyticbacter albus]
MNVFEESQGQLSGLQQLQALIAAGRRPPIADTLDFNLVEIETGRAVFAGTPGPHAYNPLGTVHGGYAATLLDSACGCAVHSTLTAAQGYTTLELKVAYHKAMTAQTGTVRAEAKVITVGKRVAFTEGRITDAAGTVYASATSTLLVFELPAK